MEGSGAIGVGSGRVGVGFGWPERGFIRQVYTEYWLGDLSCAPGGIREGNPGDPIFPAFTLLLEYLLGRGFEMAMIGAPAGA